jgi:hypothetical protein
MSVLACNNHLKMIRLGRNSKKYLIDEVYLRMRTSNIVQNSQSSREVGENAIAMSIDEASTVFLMDALGKLYSRPAQAALREYLSNAIDAHKAKGGKLPAIQITLPDSNGRTGSSKLLIRDFGKGMTEDEFSTILSRYGASTKRDSNAMIGGFGLGAKSGFAVSDEFFMTSYQQGKGIRVRIFKDALNKGYIDVIDRFTTKEADGILVELPIPSGNLYELSKKSLFTDFPFFMGYGVDAIDVKPSADFSNQSVHNPLAFTAMDFGAETLGWIGKKGDGSGKMYALIGKVAYLIDLSKFSALTKQNNTVDKELVEAVNLLNSYRVVKVINIPIGSVDLPSSREEITYSERSIRTIGAILSNYALMMKQHIQKDLNTKKTRLQVLNALSYLEEGGYKGVSDLTWKGQVLGAELFKNSDAVLTTLKSSRPYSYGSRTSFEVNSVQAKSLVKNFRTLRTYSSKVDYSEGIYRITVDSIADIPAAKKLMTKTVICDFLKIDTENTANRVSHNALFIITTKDDLLNEWLFNHKEIELDSLRTIVQKQKAEQKAQAEKAEQERVKKIQAREKAQKLKEVRSHVMLSNFIINSGSAKALSRNTVDTLFKDTKSKKFYWSEEEVTKLATVSKATKASAETGKFLFPFKATGTANSFIVVSERSNWNEINYLTKLRSFLNLFFDDGSKMIVIGKDRDLDEFKALYPNVESGVQLVKDAVVSQIADENSEIMIAYNAIGDARYQHRNEIRNFLDFVKALNKENLSKLNPELAAAAERFKMVHSSTDGLNTRTGLDEKYFLEVLKGFATLAEIKKNSYSVENDVTLLTKKYPVLLGAAFRQITEDVINDMFDYIKMCENR